jgi:hypothetical protein
MKYLKKPMTYLMLLMLFVIWLTLQYSRVNEENKVIKMDLEKMRLENQEVQSAQRLQVAKEKIQVARDKQVTSTIPKR